MDGNIANDPGDRRRIRRDHAIAFNGKVFRLIAHAGLLGNGVTIALMWLFPEGRFRHGGWFDFPEGG